MTHSSPAVPIEKLRTAFGPRLQENILLASHTTSQVGGKADGLVIVKTADEMETTITQLWDLDVPYFVLGSGSNVLISDQGVRAVVVINRTREVRFDLKSPSPAVWAESGANFSSIARQAAIRGFSGLEWAVAVPGSLGGAVYGNAGAFGSDMQHNLILAEILHPKDGKVVWYCDQMEYAYRSSKLKRSHNGAVILSATLRLVSAIREEVQARMDANNTLRRQNQPPGASMGSMFKNPPGDFAGRLIEAAGLKGKRIGGAEISSVHANFFINHKGATAKDMRDLAQVARNTVNERFGIELELEVEYIGEWNG